MTTHFENAYHTKTNRWFTAGLVAHLPVFALAAWLFKTDLPPVLLLGVLIVAGPVILVLFRPDSLLTSIAIGVASMALSGLLIHLGRGMIELHFHVFVMLAALLALGRVTPLLAAAGTIAVHHLLFFFLFPRSVFNYDASFGIVLLHAVFVILETAVVALIARQFGAFLRVQGIVSEKLNLSASTIRERTTELSGAGAGLTEASERQAASLQESSSAIEEISSMTRRNADYATNARRLAGDARKAAEAGAAQMTGMIEAMQEIRGSADGIAQILKTIDEIAFQTNMLALNAAVEAAHAGSAGAGFAVVAEAVRDLAQRAADAARETGDKIATSIKRSELGVQISTQVANSLQEIVDRARRVDALVNDIAHGSQEQAQGIGQVNTAIARLDEFTQRNAASAKSMSGTAADLQHQVQALHDLIEQILRQSAPRAPAVQTPG